MYSLNLFIKYTEFVSQRIFPENGVKETKKEKTLYCPSET